MNKMYEYDSMEKTDTKSKKKKKKSPKASLNAIIIIKSNEQSQLLGIFHIQGQIL